MNELPPAAYVAAVLSLDGMWPRRASQVLARRRPDIAWASVLRGRPRASGCPRKLALSWQAQARSIDVAELWQRHVRLGIGVGLPPSFPPVLVDDPAPPAALFHRGRLDLLDGARVAIVGTRKCTRYGRDVAYQLGAELAAVGVGVVSGLALGIDAAAHQGALAASAGPAIAVVGSGLDVVYPRANAELWHLVAERGLVVGEAPLGTRPEGWRFPARNRLIAALADVVVVVESHVRGGSMSTVDEALRRDRAVLAVPGSVRSDASAGTNRLLAEGAAPATDVDDVLAVLGCTPGRRRARSDPRPAPDEHGASVLDAVGWQPATLDQMVLRTGLDVAAVALAGETLVATGWLTLSEGWYERVPAARAEAIP
ncbi:MAG: DNA-processing protein DprA [Acidimicrobiia bacterium]|nr:DNA-processing protein DprA [Acidimicrobiia bacterium]